MQTTTSPSQRTWVRDFAALGALSGSVGPGALIAAAVVVLPSTMLGAALLSVLAAGAAFGGLFGMPVGALLYRLRLHQGVLGFVAPAVGLLAGALAGFFVATLLGAEPHHIRRLTGFGAATGALQLAFTVGPYGRALARHDSGLSTIVGCSLLAPIPAALAYLGWMLTA